MDFNWKWNLIKYTEYSIDRYSVWESRFCLQCSAVRLIREAIANWIETVVLVFSCCVSLFLEMTSAFFPRMQCEKKCEFYFARVITESKRVAYGLWRSLVHILFIKEFPPNELGLLRPFFPILLSELTTPLYFSIIVHWNTCSVRIQHNSSRNTIE